MTRQKSNSSAQKQLDKAQEEFDQFQTQVKNLTLDNAAKLPVQETEPQTKLSTKEIQKTNAIYLKPERSMGRRDKFNEAHRKKYEFDKERVNFIAENNEIIGESIEIWTAPYAGHPAEFWRVPVNKIVNGPRYLAEQIKRKCYTRLMMEENTVTGADGMGTYVGKLVAEKRVQRLDARPVKDFSSGSFVSSF